MTKTLFRSRRRATPAYPTREDDRRRLLAAGLGALLAAGPLAGCEVRSAQAEPASKPAPAESLRRGGAPRQPTEAEQPAPQKSKTPDAGQTVPYPEPLGGAPPPVRDPVPAPPPAPAPEPQDGGVEPAAVDGGVNPAALLGEPAQP